MSLNLRQICAVFAMLGLIGAAGAQTVHQLTEAHVVCTIHGVVEHAAHTQTAAPTTERSGMSQEPSEEHEEECTLLTTREPQVNEVALPAVTLAEVGEPTTPTMALRSHLSTAKILAHAPKTSPPLA